MRHTWKNAPHLEKCTTFTKMRHTYKSAAHFKKNATYLENCGTLEKVRNTWNSAVHLKKCATLKKCTSFGKMGHTWNNWPHMELVRQSQIVQSAIDSSGKVVPKYSRLLGSLPVFIYGATAFPLSSVYVSRLCMFQGSKITYNYYLSRQLLNVDLLFYDDFRSL